ncbi:Protease IV [Minicystis rosea]|nr:Protease IV [Minicystis rosea]
MLRHLPGERPAGVVVDLTGTLAPRAERPRFFGLPIRPPGQPHTPSLEEICDALDELARTDWVKRVVIRVHGVHADAATAYALHRRLTALGDAGKHTVAYLSQLDWTAYYLASAAREIAAPESADIGLRGLGLSVTFMRDALAKIGVRFEKLAIDEYKNAFDTLVRQEMSPAQREQLEALLDRFYAYFTSEIAARRGLSPERVRALIDEGITSARAARDEKLIDRLAYEDEVIDEDHRPLPSVRRFLVPRTPTLGGKRVALVSLTGAIVTGRSRSMPVPIPGLGGRTAGSETLVRALRAAASDGATAAIVLFVDSGGGSALASDLIWREVRRIRDEKPIVAVMGAMAASGGYYVLAPATRVIAAPTTITGSIGVITGKLILSDLFARVGLNAEHVRRGRYALMLDPSRPLDHDERALLARGNTEIYDRFVARVAEGRKLGTERVNELGRGRVWSGMDAVELGLADELGDLETAIARARELAGLGPDAPVWDVPAPDGMVLPSGDAEAMLDALTPFARETSWLVLPARFRIG